MVAQDHQFVQLGCFLPTIFRVAAGTAQGRRYSLPTFDAVMTGLRDDINDSTPCIKACLPTFAKKVLECAEHLSPAFHGKSNSSQNIVIAVECKRLCEVYREDCPPWNATQLVAQNLLLDLPLHGDRGACLGTFRISVDTAIAICRRYVCVDAEHRGYGGSPRRCLPSILFTNKNGV